MPSLRRWENDDREHLEIKQIGGLKIGLAMTVTVPLRALCGLSKGVTANLCEAIQAVPGPALLDRHASLAMTLRGWSGLSNSWQANKRVTLGKYRHGATNA